MADEEGCLVTCLNVHSLLKMDEVGHDVNVNTGDIVCLTKTWMRSDDKGQIIRYSFVCAAQQSDSVAADVAICVKP